MQLPPLAPPHPAPAPPYHALPLTCSCGPPSTQPARLPHRGKCKLATLLPERWASAPDQLMSHADGPGSGLQRRDGGIEPSSRPPSPCWVRGVWGVSSQGCVAPSPYLFHWALTCSVLFALPGRSTHVFLSWALPARNPKRGRATGVYFGGSDTWCAPEQTATLTAESLHRRGRGYTCTHPRERRLRSNQGKDCHVG